MAKREKTQLEEAGDSRCPICLPLHKHTSAFPNHQIELSLPCIFCVSDLRRDLVIMKRAVLVGQPGPEQMTTPGTACQFSAPRVWRLMWSRWSPKHLNHLKGCSGLTSKLSLSTKAEASEPEVLRSRPLSLQRAAESVAGGSSHCLPCRCAASDMF